MSQHKDIIIVSGLPRSGTSMMMQMLGAGGIDLVIDEKRPVDEHNSAGYFEFERVKSLQQDNSWLEDHQGKAIKILFHLLRFLPVNLSYRIIFMRRNVDDVLKSQNRMLQSYDKPTQDNILIKSLFDKALKEIEQWIMQQENMKGVFINYEDILNHPDNKVNKIETFLDRELNTEKMKSAVSLITPKTFNF